MGQQTRYTKHTKVQVYFAHPYRPWYIPINESNNGVLINYFPAATDFLIILKF